MAIEGDADFTKCVQAAVELLRTRCPDSYDQVCRYIACLKQGKHSGMWAYAQPPAMEIAQPTFHASTTWLASVIAHDSLHSKLYHDYLDSIGAPVPYDVWAGTGIEKQCNRYQMCVLRSVGGSELEYDWLAQQDGTHWDADGDGKATWADYERRNW